MWQDASTCKAYTEHAVIYAANGEKALWEDAYHPSTTGAEEHLRLLIGVLQRWTALASNTEVSESWSSQAGVGGALVEASDASMSSNSTVPNAGLIPEHP